MTQTYAGTAASIEPRLLLGPGPSPVDERILQAMARPTVGHLDPQFLAIMDDVNARLRRVFGCDHELTFPISGTGSAGMEASLVNLLEPGDKAIVGVNGVFGERLAEVARRAGAEVVRVEAEWGRIVREERIVAAHRVNPDARLVAMVMAETSTGVWQPLDIVADALEDSETLLVVDAVTALGGIPVEVERHGIDVCYAGTQKCLGVPPGLAPITFSPKALERVRTRGTPCASWYLDVSLIAGYLGDERRYHHTAPINMVYGLHEGLVALEEEGLEARWRRHRQVGRALQEALLERGFELFAQEGYRLPQLTSVSLPGGRQEGPLRKALLERHGIEVGGGLGPGKGRLWRIGLMGSGATLETVERLLEAIDDVLGAAP